MDNSAKSEKVFDIRKRSVDFAVLIVRLSALLPRNAAGFAIAGQIVRSGTSVGANIEEAQDAASKKDFIHCLVIALKEARETEYWLEVIKQSKILENPVLDSALQEVEELIKILTTIVKKLKANLTA